jgi:hypothetical protein
MVELVTRAEWTRRTAELGPTVSGTASYNIPSDVDRILHLAVAGSPWAASDEQTEQEIAAHTVVRRARGLYATTFSSTGVEQITLSPTPETSGDTIAALVVYVPTLLSDSDETSLAKIPTRFHRAIVDYAAGIGFGSDEDNVDLKTYHLSEFERRLEDLKGLRLSRLSRNPVQMKIRGVHY